jgi:serine phosphatase RsbU (regulator of sigma subunit)
VVLLTVYFQLDYPGFFPAIPLAVPLYSAAAAGHLAWPLGICAFFTGTTLFYQLIFTSEPVTQVLSDGLRDGGFLVATVLLGAVVHGRRVHAAEVAERLQRAQAESERISQELRIARLVQEQFLPDEPPDIPGWRIEAFYRSAREVGGDFYSFIDLPNGDIGIAIGDVTDKGAPAALVMATTQGLLGAEAPRHDTPTTVLEEINKVLVENTPEKMFVTCLYLVLEPASGRLRFANAGHNLPYMSDGHGIVELRATGMPLGIMPAMRYESEEAVVPPGARVLLHSDGLAEAHDRDREMFGLPRITQVMQKTGSRDDLIDALIEELHGFTGPELPQEDDITLVTLARSPDHEAPRRLQPSATKAATA